MYGRWGVSGWVTFAEVGFDAIDEGLFRSRKNEVDLPEIFSTRVSNRSLHTYLVLHRPFYEQTELGSRYVRDVRDLGRARARSSIPWTNIDMLYEIRLCELPCEGVFTASVAEDEDFEGRHGALEGRG